MVPHWGNLPVVPGYEGKLLEHASVWDRTMGHRIGTVGPYFPALASYVLGAALERGEVL